MRKIVEKIRVAVIVVIGLLILQNRPVQAVVPPQYLLQWGSPGSGDGQFAYPVGIATDAEGNVYVADTGNHRIQKFTSMGTYLTQWGSDGTGEGEFGKFDFGAVATDADGYVYVVDGSMNSAPVNPRVQKFTSTGVYLTQWALTASYDTLVCPWYWAGFGDPIGIATDTNGHVYVADWNNGRCRMHEFTNDGAWMTSWGWFNELRGVATDATGNVYVSDALASGSGRIHKFTERDTCPRELVTEWLTDIPSGGYSYGWHLATDASGNVYVAQYSISHVAIFTSAGAYVTDFGSEGDGDGQFRHPRGVATDAAGNVYVADYWNHRIQKFGPLGSTGVGSVGQPSALRLQAPSPNPSFDRTVLHFSLPQASAASLVLYDLTGRRVTQWQWSNLTAGPHQVIWTGRDDKGQPAASGTYFSRLTANGQSQTQKLVLVR